MKKKLITLLMSTSIIFSITVHASADEIGQASDVKWKDNFLSNFFYRRA